MRKLVILLLAAALCCGAAGCAMLERTYSNVQPHSSSYYESEDKSVLRAETYQDLVNDLLVLIGEHREEASIWLYAREDMNEAQQLVERACQEVQNETPMGSYAVEYMTYTVAENSRAYMDVKLTISYRRSAEQVAQLVNVTGVTALRDLLRAAADGGADSLAVQLGNAEYDAAEIYTIVEEAAGNYSDGDGWQVVFYPDESRAAIVEIIMNE